MRAMILAAGLGRRMLPLTENCPKPLLQVGGKPLISWHLDNLRRAGVSDVVINTSHLAERIQATLGDGQDYGLNIHYSVEQPQPLETLGGILRALPMLGDEAFMLINSDVWSDFPLLALRRLKVNQAHLLLVTNPEHNPAGDFSLQHGYLTAPSAAGTTYTYSGIGLFHPAFFAEQKNTSEPQPLAPLLYAQARRGRISAEHIQHQWVDVGTPERLEWLNTKLLQT